MKTIILLTACVLCLWLNQTPAQGQDLEGNVSEFTSINGKLYIQPLADTFGANMNSGLFHGARIKRMGFHLSVGLTAMGALIADEQKTFTTELEGDLPADLELPTLFGSEDGIYVNEIDATIKGVWSQSFFPLAIPQLTVGSLFGTQLTLRWFEYKIDDEIGKVKIWGIGGQHSISQYIPLCPIDLAVGYFRQSFRVGDLVDASATYLGLQASYSFSVLCFYGGFGYERSNVNISYTNDEDGEQTRIHFELDGKNKTRFTIGLLFDLPILKIFADYNMGAQNVVSAGIGLGY
ncbi:MAG: DUF6588 family protein [bacterium]